METATAENSQSFDAKGNKKMGVVAGGRCRIKEIYGACDFKQVGISVQDKGRNW